MAGFGGLLIVALVYLIYQWAYRIKIKSQYDAKFLDTGARVNPLDKTFVGKRIFLNDFVLPSFPTVDGKTFIDCEIIGPANVYWFFGNQANDIKGPVIDAIYLDPVKKFWNGFVFQNCIFRGCSFQRISLFVGDGSFQIVKSHAALNWISLTPDSIPAAQAQLSFTVPQTETVTNPPAAPPPTPVPPDTPGRT